MMAQKVCLCILMNHPFPELIPLLREIYQDRFDRLVFLIPFERSDEPDVITVYRGSYCHAGYVTDALHALRKIDCDHFVLMHDDVILNPKLDGSNFYDFFRLGPREGFIDGARTISGPLGGWIWLFGAVPKLLFPKSTVFGSGIERETLLRYLPAREVIAEKLVTAGLEPQSRIRLDDPDLHDVKPHSARTLLYGLAGPIDQSLEERQRVELACREAIKWLATSFNREVEARRAEDNPEVEIEPGVIDPGLPLVSAGFMADFYILPSACLEDFAHYSGVASAANLFVELFAPTMLYAVCDRVWNAGELCLDLSHLRQGAPPELRHFDNDRCVAMHPLKLSSTVADPVRRARLVRFLNDLRMGVFRAHRRVRPGTQLSFVEWGSGEACIDSGWYYGEPWGRWMAEPTVSIEFEVEDFPEAFRELTVFMSAPVNERRPACSGTLALNGSVIADLCVRHPDASIAHACRIEGLVRQGTNRIEMSAEMATPKEISGASDGRPLGFSLTTLAFS